MILLNIFFQYKLIGNRWRRKRTSVSLRVSLGDANDSPPRFLRAVVDEGAEQFESELKVHACGKDKTSKITYSIVDSNDMGFFAIDARTGEITIGARESLWRTLLKTGSRLRYKRRKVLGSVYHYLFATSTTTHRSFRKTITSQAYRKFRHLVREITFISINKKPTITLS